MASFTNDSQFIQQLFDSNKVNTFPLKTVVLLIIYIIKFWHDILKIV